MSMSFFAPVCSLEYHLALVHLFAVPGLLMGPMSSTWLCPLSEVVLVPGVTSAPSMSPLAEQPCSLCSPRAQIQDVDGHVAVLQKGSAGYIIWTWISSVILLAYIGCVSPHGQSFPLLYLHSSLFLPKSILDTCFFDLFLKKPFKF